VRAAVGGAPNSAPFPDAEPLSGKCRFAKPSRRGRGRDTPQAMSRDNLEVVARHMAAYLSGDYATALTAYSAYVECDTRARPEGQVYRGREGIVEAFRVWRGTWDDWNGDIEEIVDAGDRVLMVLHESGRGKASGVQVEQRTFFVYELRDRMIVRVTVLVDEDQAREAAGLQN
jgi:ketosteroid isomerase-like protein